MDIYDEIVDLLRRFHDEVRDDREEWLILAEFLEKSAGSIHRHFSVTDISEFVRIEPW
ncbi:MAG: hypothetical protein ACLQVJ_24060 [Syntrophobacteraceae bacterium]